MRLKPLRARQFFLRRSNSATLLVNMLLCRAAAHRHLLLSLVAIHMVAIKLLYILQKRLQINDTWLLSSKISRCTWDIIYGCEVEEKSDSVFAMIPILDSGLHKILNSTFDLLMAILTTIFPSLCYFLYVDEHLSEFDSKFGSEGPSNFDFKFHSNSGSVGSRNFDSKDY